MANIIQAHAELWINDQYIRKQDWNNVAISTSTSWSGGPPMDFGYTEPEPIPDKRCEYCGVRFLPKERFCIGCGAPT